MEQLPAGAGLNRAQSPEELKNWGITEQLFRPKAKELNAGWLATGWQMAPDLSKVTVTIREGVQFHKGWGELTAEDIVWSTNDTNGKITPTSIHAQAGDLASILDTAYAVDKTTFVLPFHTNDVRWELYFNLAGDSFSILSKKAFEAKGEDWAKANIIGTGPFEVVQWIRGERAILRSLPSHWDALPRFNELRMLDVPEAAARVAMLRTGEADIASLPVRDVAPLIKQGYEYKSAGAERSLQVTFSGNFWETKHAKTGEPLKLEGAYVHDVPWIGNPFKPKDANNPPGMDDMEQARLVRWALALAIDRGTASNALFGALGRPYYLPMFPTNDPNWNDKWKVPYDPKKAEELLDQAGYPRGAKGVRFSLAIFGATNVLDWYEVADAVAGYWRPIGVDTAVLHYDYSLMRPNLVARSNTIPVAMDCRSAIFLPWDWPRGEEETSLTRGGFGCAIEIPTIAETFFKVNAERDREKRIQLNNELADYMYHWMLKAGVATPEFGVVTNPRAIKEWNMRPSLYHRTNSFELLVPAR